METLMAHTEAEHEVMAALGQGNRDMETEVGQLDEAGRDAVVAAALLYLGFRAKHDGYRYLLKAVPLFAGDTAQSYSKELYPAVAAACDTGSASVERSIGRAIEKAWKRGDRHRWERFFPNGSAAASWPSNADFIPQLAELLFRMPGNELMEEIIMEVKENNELVQVIQEARQDGIRQGRIVATTAALRRLVQKLNMTPEEAMLLLEIPKKERKTYEKILANRERQKATR